MDSLLLKLMYLEIFWLSTVDCQRGLKKNSPIFSKALSARGVFCEMLTTTTPILFTEIQFFTAEGSQWILREKRNTNWNKCFSSCFFEVNKSSELSLHITFFPEFIQIEVTVWWVHLKGSFLQSKINSSFLIWRYFLTPGLVFPDSGLPTCKLHFILSFLELTLLLNSVLLGSRIFKFECPHDGWNLLDYYTVLQVLPILLGHFGEEINKVIVWFAFQSKLATHSWKQEYTRQARPFQGWNYTYRISLNE